MKKAIIFGSGGFSRSVLSLIRESSSYSVVAIVDINASESLNRVSPELIMEVPVISMMHFQDSYIDRENLSIFLAIGDNVIRQKYFNSLVSCGSKFPTLISPSANIDPTAMIGMANLIFGHTTVGPMTKLGDNNIVNTGSIIDHEASIFNHCQLALGSIIAGRVNIKDGCFLGAGSVVLEKLTLFPRVVLGAGAVLTKDALIDGGIYVGTPAMLKRKI